MYKQTLYVLKKAIGILLIVLGVISGFVPVIQGWVFILLGLFLLGVKTKTIKEWVEKAKKIIKRQKFW
ncbi:hypothetical protein HY637_01870 [Candidatus Woesearchaeota archaeon]|nr:hypothetical protein [Candidatus Woesearchaeota archaeon]